MWGSVKMSLVAVRRTMSLIMTVTAATGLVTTLLTVLLSKPLLMATAAMVLVTTLLMELMTSMTPPLAIMAMTELTKLKAASNAVNP